MSPDNVDILRKRAKALACKPADPDAVAGELLEVVEFTLADETYGVSSRCVQEIIDLKEITPVPGTPPFIAGIINLRGGIIAVIDIKKFFGLPEKGLVDTHKVIVVRHAGVEAGLLADKLIGMKRFSPADIQPTLPTLTGIRADYLQGVTPDRVVLLDAAKILLDKNLIVDESPTGELKDPNQEQTL